MRAIIRALAAWLLGPVAPHQCMDCHSIMRRLAPEQQAQRAAGRAPICPYCNGLMLALPDGAAS